MYELPGFRTWNQCIWKSTTSGPVWWDRQRYFSCSALDDNGVGVSPGVGHSCESRGFPLEVRVRGGQRMWHSHDLNLWKRNAGKIFPQHFFVISLGFLQPNLFKSHCYWQCANTQPGLCHAKSRCLGSFIQLRITSHGWAVSDRTRRTTWLRAFLGRELNWMIDS